MKNQMNKRDKQLIILGMHAAWMSLPRILANSPIVDGTELSQRIARHIYDLARAWELTELPFHELNARMDEIEKIPVRQCDDQRTVRPEENN